MNNLDLLRPMAVFAEVVECGSFRGAAERLGLSAPYVSQLVSDLESRLGKQLLYRSTRKISLTDAGEEFLIHARTLSGAFHTGIRQGPALSGRLRVAAPSVAASPLFARIVAQFAEAYPEVTLEVMLDDASTDPVAAKVDLAIRIGDPGDDPRLARKLFETRGKICCAPEFAAAIHSLQDLDQLLWVRTPNMAATLTVVDAQGTPVALSPPRQMVLNSANLTRSVLAETPSFAVFPEFAVREALAEGTLCTPCPAHATPAVPAYALFTERRTELANARAFVDALVSGLQGG